MVHTVLVLLGYIPPNGDTAVQFGAFSTTGTFAPNSTFSSKSGGLAAFYFTDYTSVSGQGVDIYKANPQSPTYLTPVEDIKVTILTYNSTTRIVTGTFTGTALNKAGTTVNITNGRFSAKYRKT